MSPILRSLVLVALAGPLAAQALVPRSLVPVLAGLGGAALLVAAVHLRLSGIRRSPSSTVALALVLWPTLASVAGSTSPLASLAAWAALVGVMLGICYVSSALTWAQIRSLAWPVFTAVPALSIVALAAGVPSAWERGRFRGVMENSNPFSFSCAIAIALVPSRLFLPVTAVSMPLIWISGGRAGLLSALVAVAARSEWRPKSRLASAVVLLLVFGGIGAAMAQAAAEVDPLDNDSVLRTNDSRSEQWGRGMSEAAAGPIFGIGYGAATAEYSSSLVLNSVELGLLAVPTVGGALVLAAAAVHRRRAHPLVLALLFNLIFEGWLLASGSVFSILFWLVVISSRRRAR